MNKNLLIKLFLIGIIQFFLLTLSANAQSVLQQPANNADCIRKDSIIFKWGPDGSANLFYVTISPNADLSFPTYNQYRAGDSTQTLLSVPLNSATYYWQIRSVIEGFPPTIHNSAIWSFKTLAARPTLTSPTNNNSCAPKICTFQWQNVSGATYTLQISDNINFSSYILNQSNLSTNSFTFTLPAYNSIYYWRVFASYGSCVTDNSTTFRLTTQSQGPVLTTPGNQSLSLSASGVRFKWTYPIQPTNFKLQIATDSNFSAGSIFYDANKTAKTDTVSNLQHNTYYYWRVSGDNSGCPIPWSDPYFSFLTNYSTPNNPSAVPDSCDPTHIRFYWTEVPATTSYHLQISENADMSSPIVNPTGIAANFYDYFVPKAGQKYYWHVKAEDAQNSGDWTKTEGFSSSVSSVTRLQPANNAVNQPDTLSLKWTKPAQFSNESIQVATDKDFKNLVADLTNLTEDSVVVALPDYNRLYYWHIQSDYNSCNNTWSDAWKFTTTIMPPVLIYPDNNSTGQSQNITFQWQPSPGAATYEFSLATNKSFQAQYIVKGNVGITTPRILVQNLTTSTTMYWRVRASNSSGKGPWSNVFKFRTGSQMLEVPNLKEPANGQANLPIVKVTLTWDAVTSAKFYRLQFDTTGDFIKPIKDISDLKANQFDATALSYITTYYWRVMAIGDSSQSDWSPAWSFSTFLQFPTDKVPLTSPANGSINNSDVITFKWDTVKRGKFYDFQLSSDNQFTSGKIIYNDTMVSQNSIIVDSLKNYETYYWRVRAWNYSGTALWSDTWSFAVLKSSVDDLSIQKYDVNIQPNPANGIFTISLNLLDDANVKIEIADLTGRSIVVISDKLLESGKKFYTIDAGKYLNGIYLCNFTIDGISFSKKIVIIK